MHTPDNGIHIYIIIQNKLKIKKYQNASRLRPNTILIRKKPLFWHRKICESPAGLVVLVVLVVFGGPCSCHKIYYISKLS